VIVTLTIPFRAGYAPPTDGAALAAEVTL
jgi:hypothetical protein